MILFPSVAVISLERSYFFAIEGSGRADLCAIVEDGSSVSFQFNVRFIFTPDSASMCSYIKLV